MIFFCLETFVLTFWKDVVVFGKCFGRIANFVKRHAKVRLDQSDKRVSAGTFN